MRRIFPTLAIIGIALAVPLGGAVPAAAQDYAMPVLTKTEPAETSEVVGPVNEVVLEFDGEVDLVEVKLLTPDQREIKLYAADGSDADKKGVWFALPLPEPATMPGTWLIDYSVSKSFPDGKASATSAYSGFTIIDPAAGKPQAEEGPAE